MNAVQTQEKTPPPRQESEMERRIKRFMEAAILVNPDLKDRLNMAACIQYFDLPDSTFGWDATNYKTPGPMPVEYKTLCLMLTVTNGLPPGSIIWLGNGPYARASAVSFVANRDAKSVSGITFRAFTEEEKSMFAIGEKDMAVVAEREVILYGHSMLLQGYGVLGWDESQPNSKGNYKVAMEKTRDRMQFVRTRAIRDMYSRHISISGVPSEDDYYPDPIEDAQPMLPVEKAPAPWAKPDPVHVDAALEARIEELSEKVKAMGGDVKSIVSDPSLPLAVAIKIMESWIEANEEKSEPPKPKRARKTKAIQASEGDTMVVNGVETILENEAQARRIEGTTIDLTGVNIEVTLPSHPANEMADTVSPDEIADIVDNGPVLDYDLPEDDEIDPIFEGTEEQKDEIRRAAKEAGLPEKNGILHALAGAMRGQPMSKLPVKVKAIGKTITADQVKTQAPKATTSEDDLFNAKEKLKEITDKVTKMGGKTMPILGGRSGYTIATSGTYKEIAEATVKLWDWYEKAVNG